MPPLVAAVAAVASFSFAGIAVGQIAISLAISVGLSFVSQALQRSINAKAKKKKAAANSGNFQKVTVREPVAPRRIVYGRTRIAGTIVYIQTTDSNQYLHMVIALCEGPIDAIETIYFNDQALPATSGSISSGNWAGYVYLESFTGSPTQAACATLIAASGGAWTSAHTLSGVAYLYVRMTWSDTVWPNGVPNITAVVRGRPLYDPRTSAAAWSRNAALALRDMLLLPQSQGGVGAENAEIDDVSFIAAANICDEAVATPVGTEARYCIDGIVELDEASTPQEMVASLLTACAGRLTFWGGKWRLIVGAWRSPTFTITDGMLRGPLQVETRISRREQFNAVKGQFISVADLWTPKDYPAITSAAFEAEDGGTRIYRDLTLEWTVSPYAAQRLAKIELYRSREPITVKALCKLHAYTVTVGDVIYMTHERWGWTNKTFDVAEVSFSVGDDGLLGVDLTLRETSAAVYDWLASEATLFAASPPTSLPNWALIGAPSLSLASGDDELIVAGDGTIISRIRVGIVATDVRTTRWEIAWKRSADTVWTDPVSIGASGENAWWISPVQDDELYDVRARAVTVIGSRSPWTTVSGFRVVGRTQPPPNVVAVDLIGSTLVWSYPNRPADFSGYRVRYQSGTISHWPSAQPAHTGLLAAESLLVAPYLSGVVTFLVKAVDTSGNESEVAGTVTATLDGTAFQNEIQRVDYRAAGFPGTIGSGSIVGGDLVGNSTALYWSSNEKDPFWRPDQTLFWPADTYGPVLWTTTFAPAADLLDASIYIDASLLGTNQAIFYRPDSAAPFWGPNDSGLFWDGGDATTFWEPLGDWLAWPGALSGLRQQNYEIRVSIAGGPVQPTITAFELVYAVPDVSETLANVSISASGTRLVLSRSYRVIEAVTVTVQGTAAVTARVEDKLATGPLVRCFDSTGVPAGSTIDAIVQGY